MSVTVRVTGYKNYTDGERWKVEKYGKGNHFLNMYNVYVNKIFTEFTTNGVEPTYNKLFEDGIELVDDPVANAEIIKKQFTDKGNALCKVMHDTEKPKEKKKSKREMHNLDAYIKDQIHHGVNDFEDAAVRKAFVDTFQNKEYGEGEGQINYKNAGFYWAIQLHNQNVISDVALLSIFFCTKKVEKKTDISYEEIGKRYMMDTLAATFKKFIWPESSSDRNTSISAYLFTYVDFVLKMFDKMTEENLEKFADYNMKNPRGRKVFVEWIQTTENAVAFTVEEEKPKKYKMKTEEDVTAANAEDQENAGTRAKGKSKAPAKKKSAPPVEENDSESEDLSNEPVANKTPVSIEGVEDVRMEDKDHDQIYADEDVLLDNVESNVTPAVVPDSIEESALNAGKEPVSEEEDSIISFLNKKHEKHEEHERVERERLEKEEADERERERVERKRLENEEADERERERVERERLEKEEADERERERVEKERLEKEKADERERERVEKERLEKEEADERERERVERKHLEKEKADERERERVERERLEKEEADEREREQVNVDTYFNNDIDDAEKEKADEIEREIASIKIQIKNINTELQNKALKMSDVRLLNQVKKIKDNDNFSTYEAVIEEVSENLKKLSVLPKYRMSSSKNDRNISKIASELSDIAKRLGTLKNPPSQNKRARTQESKFSGDEFPNILSLHI